MSGPLPGVILLTTAAALLLAPGRVHPVVEQAAGARGAAAWPRGTLPVLAAVLVLGSLRYGLPLIPVGCALGAAAGVAREVLRARQRTAVGRRSEQVLSSCTALAGDLRAGSTAEAALATAARDWPELAPVAQAARLDADVPAALRALAGRPGAGQLRIVAAAWAVAHRTGASLAGTVELAGAVIREQQATARTVAAELAAAQATARLLALLPFGVLMLGRGLGGDPFGFLLGTLPGQGCLVVGLGLGQLGLVWMHRIAWSVESG